ncbi:MAG: hypothetical protein AB8G05_22975 [Oligoflexales bacterium]
MINSEAKIKKMGYRLLISNKIYTYNNLGDSMYKKLLFILIPIGITCVLSGCESQKKELMEKMENEKSGAMEKMEMSKAEWKQKVKENCPKNKFKNKKSRKECISTIKNKT